jgi:hypothetical protein
MRLNTFYRLMLAMGFGFLLMSYQNCGGYKSAASSGSSLSASGASALSQANNGGLLGTWTTGCTAVAGSTTQQMQTVTTEFSSGGVFLIKQIFFATSDCSGAGLYSVKFSGTYTYSGPSSNVSGASLMNTAPNSSAVLAVFDPNALSAFNSYSNNSGICGVQWTLNTPQTVTPSAGCVSTSKAGSNQLFQINNQILYFGNQSNSAIDTSVPYSYVSVATPDVN